MGRKEALSNVVDFLQTTKFLENLLVPAQYRPTGRGNHFKNITVFGSMGVGKSTALNAIMHQVVQKHKCPKSKMFVAKASTESVTKDVSSILVNGNMQFIDNPGFNDPDPKLSDFDLWQKLCVWFRTDGNEVLSHGHAGFINIISVPASKRPAKDSYMNVARLLLSLSMVYPSFPMKDLEKGNFPAFYTVFTNFSPFI